MVAFDARVYLCERIAFRPGRIGKGIDGFVDELGVIGRPFDDRDQRPKVLRSQFLDLRIDDDFSKPVKIAFVHRERDIEILPVRREFGDRGNDTEIRIAALKIKAAQLFAIEGQTIRIVVVVRGQDAPPGTFFRRDLAPQRVVVEMFVADKRDARHAGGWPLVDRENQIDPVLRPLNDLGIHRCGEFSVAAVQFDDTLDVRLHLGAREYRSRLLLNLLLQVLVGNLVVTFEHDLIEYGVLHHVDR